QKWYRYSDSFHSSIIPGRVRIIFGASAAGAMSANIVAREWERAGIDLLGALLGTSEMTALRVVRNTACDWQGRGNHRAKSSVGTRTGATPTSASKRATLASRRATSRW